jgi:hypothetical protein
MYYPNVAASRIGCRPLGGSEAILPPCSFAWSPWPPSRSASRERIVLTDAVENRSPSSKPETNLFTFGKTGAPGEALLGLDEVVVGARGAHRLQAPV